MIGNHCVWNQFLLKNTFSLGSLFYVIFLFFIFPGNVLFAQIPDTQLEIGSSPNPVGSGARALGFGNAFIAIADDATVASWNPGGLTTIEHPEISFALDFVSRREKMSSSSNPEARSTNSVRLEEFNYLSIVYPLQFRTKVMAFSLNYLKLYNFGKTLRFPLSGSDVFERNFVFDFDQDGNFSVVAPAFAIDVTKSLSLGLTFNIWNHSLTDSSAYDKTQVETGTFEFGGNPGQFSQTSDERFEVDEGYSFVLGGIYRFNDRWKMGLVIKPPYTLNIDHKRIETFVQTGMAFPVPLIVAESKSNSELEFPLILGIGASWKPIDPFMVSFDATWTQWSEYTFEQNGRKTNPITAQEEDEGDLDDTYTLRVGFEYVFFYEEEQHKLPIRWGFGYDPAPVVKEVDDFYTLNFGAGYQLGGKYNFDIAYEYRWGSDVNGDTIQGLKADQDVDSHRFLASLIRYF